MTSADKGHQLIRIAIITALITILPLIAAASDVTLRIVNDPSAGNSRPDDLYTSDLQIEVRGDTQRLVFGERMFTDRERRLRFDETHLSVATSLPPLGRWETEASIGLLHVGKGLLGESMQNSVHRRIGSTEVSLPYVPDEKIYPTASFVLSRQLTDEGGLRTLIEAHTAPGFRNWVRASIEATRPIGRTFEVGAGIGLRADLVETPWIARDIRGTSPTGHVSMSWRALELRASWNDYGTRSPHVSLGFKVDTP